MRRNEKWAVGVLLLLVACGSLETQTRVTHDRVESESEVATEEREDDRMAARRLCRPFGRDVRACAAELQCALHNEPSSCDEQAGCSGGNVCHACVDFVELRGIDPEFCALRADGRQQEANEILRSQHEASRDASTEVHAVLTRVDRLVVYKERRRMEAFLDGDLVRSYQIAIGGGESGPKLHEGDRRTPEGTYRIDSRHPSQRFHRFLHVSYPNPGDRQRFQLARRERNVTPGARIGGSIGIHGSPAGLSALAENVRYSWTDGCIAVTNDEVEELYDALVDNAVVEITP